MRAYLDLCKLVLDKGVEKADRTGTGTISYFGTQTRYDLGKGFPLLTTKKVHIKSILHELIWFISGNTNIRNLVKNNVRIWNDWPYLLFKKSPKYQNETMAEFVEKIKSDSKFSDEFGELGPIYGKQWRNFGGIDQLQKAIDDIKTNPNSRRIIVSSWNPPLIDKMALPPCHTFYQFYVNGNKLSCQLYQRSADVFLGVPFNIASYAFLIHMIAAITGLEVGEFIHTTGDTHIYKNHLEQIKTQIQRVPFRLSKLVIKRKVNNINDFTFDDFEIIDYQSHPAIKGKVAV